MNPRPPERHPRLYMLSPVLKFNFPLAQPDEATDRESKDLVLVARTRKQHDLMKNDPVYRPMSNQINGTSGFKLLERSCRRWQLSLN